MEQAEAVQGAIILFDGECAMCAAIVRFVYRRDRGGKFRFASLQSAAGRLLLREHGLNEHALDTFVLIRGDRHAVKSTAALQVCRGLDGLWPLCYAGIAVPRPIRDRVYDWVAHNRYRWFGRSDACLMPTQELRKRFFEDGNT